MDALRLQCYQCETEYGYIGTTPHPGRCPVCDSPCVPPAGELALRDSICWQSANGLAKINVRAVDERDRTFVFEVAAHGYRGKLVTISIGGVSVTPRFQDALSQLPSKVENEIADFGITDLETSLKP